MNEEYGYYPVLEIYPYPKLFSWKTFLAGSTIVLQWLVSGFLTVILLLKFLSQKTICTTCMIDNKKKEQMAKKDYWKKLRFSQKIIIKVSFRSENLLHVFDNIKTIKRYPK